MNIRATLVVLIVLLCTARISAQDARQSPSALDEFIRLGLTRNPRLAELDAQVQAAWAKVPQADALPDPMISSNIFAQAIETAAGSQRAHLSISQRIPSLKKLDALGRQRATEATALEYLVTAEALHLIAQIKIEYYRLYFLGWQIRISEANQTILRGLGKVAEARVRVGVGQSDVLRTNLELAELERELLRFRQEVVSTTARLNQLLNRPPTTPIPIPESLLLREPRWEEQQLIALALANQPELQNARLRYQAALIGVDVARLSQIPDLTVGLNWAFIESNRPPTNVVDVGQDAWSIGLGVTIPIWREKYRALQEEATAYSRAEAAGLEDLARLYEARIADQLAQARTARETTDLYAKTIIPQARLTFESVQKGYVVPNSAITFERLMTEYRNQLNARIGYHRAITELAISEALIEQSVGVPLSQVPVPPSANTPRNGKRDSPDDDTND